MREVLKAVHRLARGSNLRPSRLINSTVCRFAGVFGELSLFDTDLMEELAALGSMHDKREHQQYHQLRNIGMLAGTLIEKITPFVENKSMTIDALKASLTAESMQMLDFPGGPSLMDYVGKIYENEGSGRTGKLFGLERVSTEASGALSFPSPPFEPVLANPPSNSSHACALPLSPHSSTLFCLPPPSVTRLGCSKT